MLLSSRAGLLLYLTLPNHWVWRLLSAKERAQIKSGNRRHNVERKDYADPALYQGGVGFDSPPDPRREHHRLYLRAFLERVRPASILEIGPGSGYLTRTLVEHPAVRHYVAADLNSAFLEFLRPRLSALNKPGFLFGLVHGIVDDVPVEPFDAIVLCSSVHHIPDRVELFQALSARLAPGGRIVAVDPTHYVGRVRKMLRKAAIPGYLTEKLREARAGELSTHAMCTLADYRRVMRLSGLEIARVEFSDRPPRVERLRAKGLPLGPLWRWAAEEITIECVRR